MCPLWQHLADYSVKREKIKQHWRLRPLWTRERANCNQIESPNNRVVMFVYCSIQFNSKIFILARVHIIIKNSKHITCKLCTGTVWRQKCPPASSKSPAELCQLIKEQYQNCATLCYRYKHEVYCQYTWTPPTRHFKRSLSLI